jgi:Ni/Co efflux regulator RcnB
MKKAMIAMLAFSFLAGTTVFAQDATPTTKTKKAKKHHKKDKKNASSQTPKSGN